MTFDRIWHFSGESAVPPQLRHTPYELSDSDLRTLTLLYDVMIYRDDEKLVLALDARGKKFRQR